MAILDFLKRKKSDTGFESEEQPAPAESNVTAMPEAPPTPLKTIPDLDEELDANEPNIDKIRDELQAIASLIGRGTSYDVLSDSDSNLSPLTISYPDLVGLVPDAFAKDRRDNMPADKNVTILVPDLFEQLTNGSVEAPVSQLIADVDDEYLASDLADIKEGKVLLPLPLVVSSIQPDELTQRTTKVERDPTIDDMPDVFATHSAVSSSVSDDEPDMGGMFKPGTVDDEELDDLDLFNPDSVKGGEEEPAPVVEPDPEPFQSDPVLDAAPAGNMLFTPDTEAVPDQPEPALNDVAFTSDPDSDMAAKLESAFSAAPIEEPAAPETEPAFEKVPDQSAAAFKPEPPPVPESPEPPPVENTPAAASAPASTDSEDGHAVLLRGLDLNLATAEEMVLRLDGVGPKMAVRLVEDRDLNGDYTDIYDLARVQGVGRKTFESITGMVWKEELCSRRRILAHVLDASKSYIPDIKLVAEKIKDIQGFEGCVIAHQDGYVLASSWDHRVNDVLGAFAPQMFKKVVKYIKRLDLGGMDSFTFFFDDYPITLVNHGDIYIASVHTPNRFSRRHVQITRALTAELARRLKRFSR